MPKFLAVDGILYEIEREEIMGQKNYVGIYNTQRMQYEVYYEKQAPTLVPHGVDDKSIMVAFADAQRDIVEKNRVK